MNTSALLSRAFALAALMLVLPLTVTAQPRQNQVAAGADVGLFYPADDQFDGGLIGGAYLEFYPAPRLGIRPSFFATSTEFERGTDEHMRQRRLGVDVIYNWEGGRVHPFIGAGMGAHMLQFTNDGEDVGESTTELGLALLGGLEIFLNRAWTLKGEARYHWVDDRPGVNPNGLGLTFGLKRYF